MQALQKMLWVHFSNFLVQKRSGLLWSPDAFWKFSSCKVYRKRSGRIFSIFASKNETVCCEVPTHCGSFRVACYIQNVLGAFSRFVRPKTKLIAVKFRRILEILWLQVLQKKFWAQFLDLFVLKRSYLLWSSGAFWKFSLCEFYEKRSGCIFSIFACKNEAVCREVQTRFESSQPARFTEKVLGAISRYMCEKMKLFAVKFRRILEVSSCKVYRKCSGRHFTIYVFKNEAVCCEVQTHFGSSRFVRFTEKVLGAFSRFF